MKIKVTYEKIFDSDTEYAEGYEYSYQEFENTICESITEMIDLSDDEWKFEEIKEDDSK